MNSSTFYKELNEKVKDLSKEQIIEFLNNLVRKIPEDKYEEIINMFNDGIDLDKEKLFKKNINNYRKQFDLIDDGELCFHATGYEDYSDGYRYWGGDWIWEYTDDEDIGKLIDDAVSYAYYLVNNKLYKEAKELLDLVLSTNYQVIDDDGGDDFEITLTELKENGLINMDVNTLCSYAIYTTYQCTSEKDRAKEIYEYFNNKNFRYIKIEDSFKLGSEVLKDIDNFYDNWINLLVNLDEKIAYRLLSEAFLYTNYNNYNKYVKEISKNHPSIYLNIFEFLVKNEKIDKMLELGNDALTLVDENLLVRSDISLYLAKYDKLNEEKYLIESFKSKTNVPNLIRINNNGYYDKNKELINKLIGTCDNLKDNFSAFKINEIDKKTFYYLKFFTGSFDEVYQECLKCKDYLGWSSSFVGTAVYLWLILLNNNYSSKVYQSILNDVFDKLGFNKDLSLLDNDYSDVINKWKDNFTVTNVDIYLKWLEQIVESRVDAIISGNYRSSYFKAAKLVVALGEVLEVNNITTKEEFINSYRTKYNRRTAFKSEINKYL